jgi:acyltransferase
VGLIRVNLRENNIDYLKGILIILVVAGHIILGTLENSFLRHMIYSFHMPLFIAISGFLFNLELHKVISFLGILRKYFLRIILPWVEAIFLFLFFSVLSNHEKISFYKIVDSIIHPYFHLWFIPAFIFWIVCVWGLLKLNFSIKQIIFVSFFISLLSFSIKLTQRFSDQFYFLENIQYTLRPYFLFFFVLGIYIRQTKIIVRKPFYLITVMLFFIEGCYFFKTNSLWEEILLFFGLNIFLFCSVVRFSKSRKFPKSKIIEWLGYNSLAIYLWHIIPLLLVKFLTPKNSEWHYYLLVIICELIFLVIYHFLVQISLLRKYAFGL